ncbi:MULTISPECIES: GNAT family N-acetyltransferase [unclassified Exiguobacterium]|uniref:GNAT family N-acetyltransferase n=1 Tax=unclassified Exiguobacterium TaxID=2644629 RepID=UPI001BEC04F9|nr:MULTISPECIES: GNAT family N-acetyltransferase [unclassified Exiguobacterium]
MFNQQEKVVRIRTAENRDIVVLAELMGELGYPTTEEQMAKRFMTIQQDSNYHTFIAVEDQEIVGMIGCFKGLSYEKDESYIRIVALVVKSSRRKNGIGALLVNHVQEWAYQQEIMKIAVNTGNRRVVSHEFYKKIGFEGTGTGYYKSLQKNE